MTACLAALLSASLGHRVEPTELAAFDEVYRALAESDDEDTTSWCDVLEQTLAPYGFQPAFLGDADLVPRDYAMALGTSPRGRGHAVVLFDGRLIFDPHPSGDGLEAIDMFAVFVRVRRRGGEERH